MNTNTAAMEQDHTLHQASSSEDKTVAIVAYITLIGFIVALIIHSSKKTQLGSFHLRQMLGLVIANFVAGAVMIIPVLGWIAGFALFVCNFIMWVMGLIAAANGEMKPAPILGAKFQEWFKNAFA